MDEKTDGMRASESWLQLLLEYASDLVAVVDARGAISYVSPSIRRLGGYEPEDVTGRAFLDFTHPDDHDESTAAFTELLRDPATIRTTEFRFRHKDGRWLALESVSRNALADPVVRGVVVNARDVTERKRTMSALATSELQYRRLFEAARDGILTVEVASGQILDVNPFMIELLGYTREQYLGKKLWEIGLFKDVAASKSAFAELQAKRYVRFEDLPLRTAHGKEIEVEFVSNVYPVGGGEVIQCNIRDITERKQAEEHLRRLNWALRALSQGNSALVHAQSESELFRSCCEAIGSSGGYALAWIGIARNDSERSVEIVAAAGEALGYMEGLEVSWSGTELGRGPAGIAIRTGAIQVINDLANSPGYRPWFERARAFGLATVVVLPIRVEGAVFAVLTVFSGEPDAFGDDEVKLLDQMAADIGYGIGTRRTRAAYESGLIEREQHGLKLRATLESAIAALAATVEQRDPYTAGHQRRVAELAVAIGRELGLDEERLAGLRITGSIHDIGKIYVPAEILSRPGTLGAAEFELVKGHAQVGHEIVQAVDFPWPVAQTIWQHHERLDGSGYPQGLKAEQIILEARILAVADVVEAMASHRPYRAGLGIDAALAQVRRDSGTKLDAEVVAACERVFREKGFELPVV
jgi:PAS domain S-box-containing protein